MNAAARPTPPSDYAPGALRVALARLGVSGRELARRLDLSPNWVSLRITGGQAITQEDAELIADALGVPLGELMGVAAPPPQQRLAPVLNDVQAFLHHEDTTKAQTQFLLRGIRGLLDIVRAEPAPEEPQMRRKEK